MIQIESFDKITFKYNSGTIPPPFCHKYYIEIKAKSLEVFRVKLQLEYYDRDTISEDEIFEEGFSLEDDFTWSGPLPKVWGEEIIKKLKSSNWKKKPLPSSSSSEFTIKVDHHNESEILQPADTRTWEIFVQEIIQAIFELSEKEAPLFLSYVSKSSEEQINQADFNFSFAQRKISITSQNNSLKNMTWTEGQKLLKFIFSIDYLPENGSEQVPNLPGNYISPGDGWWYELAPYKNSGKDAIDKIDKLNQSLLNYTR